MGKGAKHRFWKPGLSLVDWEWDISRFCRDWIELNCLTMKVRLGKASVTCGGWMVVVCGVLPYEKPLPFLMTKTLIITTASHTQILNGRFSSYQNPKNGYRSEWHVSKALFTGEKLDRSWSDPEPILALFQCVYRKRARSAPTRSRIIWLQYRFELTLAPPQFLLQNCLKFLVGFIHSL